jgi:hypothetical protein
MPEIRCFVPEGNEQRTGRWRLSWAVPVEVAFRRQCSAERATGLSGEASFRLADVVFEAASALVGQGLGIVRACLVGDGRVGGPSWM